MKYTAPEVLLSSDNSEYISGPKVDTWSLGVILSELVFQKQLWPSLKLGQCLRKVLSLIYNEDVLTRFARESDNLQIYQVSSFLSRYKRVSFDIHTFRHSPGDES